MKKLSNQTRITALLLALILLASVLTGRGEPESDEAFPTPPVTDNGAVAFRPAENGLTPRAVYEYPYMGLTVNLTDALVAKMNSLDVILLTKHNYSEDGNFTHAFLRWYALTEVQKNETVEALDPDAWEADLAKIGAIGAYDSASAQQLDALTGCTQHKELGKSSDGRYTYYMSLSDAGGSELKAELEKTQVTLTERLPLNLELGSGVFSEARGNAANVGNFTAKDIDGNEFTQDYLKKYDLTLVNIFTTWCTYCIQEMPHLQRLSKEMAAQGVGVVGVVHDAVDDSGKLQSNVVDLTKTLRKRAGITFPLVIPDTTGMNGRLKGVSSYPESFFVDRNGNIIGEPLLGARDFKSWKSLTEQTLAQVKGN